jgi:glycine/D-amino acid oxidase-like deaminating enzyme
VPKGEALPSARSSLWLDGLGGPNFKTFSGGPAYDIVIVGGGIAGLLVAAQMSHRGLRIALVEASRVGRGVTGHTTGKVSALQQTAYSRIGDEDAAASYAAASLAGRALIEELINKHEIACDWELRDAWTFANRKSQAGRVESELDAALVAGLPVAIESETPLPFETWGSVRLRDQAQFNAAAFVVGLARMLSRDAGVEIFERTRVTGLREHSSGVELRTEFGNLYAERAVIASHFPFADRGGFFARLSPQRSYAIACELADDPPEGMFISAGSPTRSLRTAVAPGGGKRRLLLVGGEGHRVGGGRPSASYARLGAWAAEHFSVRKITHTWSTQDNMTRDHLPMAGRLRPTSDKVFVVTGFNKWGFATAGAAAIELDRLIHEEPREFADVFEPWRASTGELFGLAGAGLKFAEHFTYDHVAHRDAPTCTHMGCKLKRNLAEDSWDCPCHGSRFDLSGRVLQGPATKDLELD